jgi:hypothetical protein
MLLPKTSNIIIFFIGFSAYFLIQIVLNKLLKKTITTNIENENENENS